MSSIAVLYGTTADDNVRPVLCNDSGQLVTDQSGGTNWYENLYVGGTEGDPSISLLSSGDATFKGSITTPLLISGTAPGGVAGQTGVSLYDLGILKLQRAGDSKSAIEIESGDGTSVVNLRNDGTAEFAGDVYARQFIDSDGYDLGKIGQALSTIHDVIESVDDLQGLKNLFHLLLDNLKSDPTPPAPEPPE